MSNTLLEKLGDNIWFTYKARMIAYERLKQNDFHSQLILVWYTLFLALVSISLLKKPLVFGKDIDLITALFSVVILVVSLIISNQDWRGRSISMRSNYLRLQELYREISIMDMSRTTIDDLERRYTTELDLSENHSRIDDIISRMRSGDGLNNRIVLSVERRVANLYKWVKKIYLILLYILPLMIYRYGLIQG